MYAMIYYNDTAILTYKYTFLIFISRYAVPARTVTKSPASSSRPIGVRSFVTRHTGAHTHTHTDTHTPKNTRTYTHTYTQFNPSRTTYTYEQTLPRSINRYETFIITNDPISH